MSNWGRIISLTRDVGTNSFVIGGRASAFSQIAATPADCNVQYNSRVLLRIQFQYFGVNLSTPCNTFIGTVDQDFDPATPPIIGPLAMESINVANDFNDAGTATADPTQGQMTVRVDGLQTLVQSDLGTAYSLPNTFLEVQGFIGAATEFSFYDRFPFPILNIQYQGGASPPTPPESYYTAPLARNIFAKKIGLPGETIILVSPDGTKAYEIGCNDDGTFKTELINPYIAD